MGPSNYALQSIRIYVTVNISNLASIILCCLEVESSHNLKTFAMLSHQCNACTQSLSIPDVQLLHTSLRDPFNHKNSTNLPMFAAIDDDDSNVHN